MTLIGPRPQLVRDMVFMSEEQRMRHTAKPGLDKMLQFYKGLKLVKGLLFKLEVLLYRIFQHVQLQEDIRRKYLK